MSAENAVALLRVFAQNDIPVIVDGGWAVDALLGRQTRVHGDLDIALEHRHVPKLRALLEARGFSDVPRDDTRDCNFVLGDAQGRQVDVHSFTFDDAGNCVFGCAYPLESLEGNGQIEGYALRCITAKWLVQFHTGYALDENDYRDVRALCERFGLEIPADYAAFE